MNITRTANFNQESKYRLYKKTNCSPRCGPLLDYSKWSNQIYTVSSINELEQPIQKIIIENLERNEDICQIVVSPRQENNLQQAVKDNKHLDQKDGYWNCNWVFVLTEKNLLLLAADKYNDKPKARMTPIDNLLSIEWGGILLNSWIEWSWIQNNNLEYTRVEFNTVSEQPMKEIVAHLFGSSNPRIVKNLPGNQKSNEVFLNNLPFRYKVRVRLCLLPTEKIRNVVYSPSRPSVLESNYFGLIKKLVQKAIPSFSLILTDRQIIILRDEGNETGFDFGEIVKSAAISKIRQLFVEKDSQRSLVHLVIGNESVEESILLYAGTEIYTRLFDFCQNFVIEQK